MRGVSATTGKALSGRAHLEQSIRDILTTPIGSRVMRRDYGSRCFEFIDAPMNRRTILELYAASIEALNAWEPRIKIKRVFIENATEGGKVELTIESVDADNGSPIVVSGIVL